MVSFGMATLTSLGFNVYNNATQVYSLYFRPICCAC